MKSGVYEIENSASGRRYVGSTSDLNRRRREHFRDLRKGEHANPIIQRSYDLHGEEAFIFRVLRRCEDYQEKEQELLDNGPYLDRETGFNISRSACGGDTWTDHPDRAQLIMDAMEYNSGEGNGMFGKEHSDETKGRMVEKAAGRFSLEWFQDRHGDEEGQRLYENRCEQRSEHMRQNNPMDDAEARAKLRGERSEETKAKISRSLKGRSVTWGDKISASKKGQLSGKNNPNYTDVDMERLQRGIMDGETVQDLKDALGCSNNVIYSRLKDMGFSGLREARRELT